MTNEFASATPPDDSSSSISDAASTAKEQASNVGHDAAESAKNVAGTAKTEASKVVGESKKQAKALYSEARSSPPVQHLDDILRNGRRFADRWGQWPMTGWLEAFEREGAVRRDGDGWVRTPA